MIRLLVNPGDAGAVNTRHAGLRGIRGMSLARFVILLLSFILMLSYILARWSETRSTHLRPVEFQGEWIKAPGDSSTGYFRKRFDLTSRVKHAWMMITADEAFEVSINKNPIGHQFLWRATRPFQNGTSEKGQRVIPDQSAMALNFPREYQWTNHNNALLPHFLDITNDFDIGRNTVCVEIESRGSPATVNFHGEIVLYNGEVIPIRSDTSWRSEPVPTGPQPVDWTHAGYWDKGWRYAEPAAVDTRTAFRSLPPQVFSTPFDGTWMQARPDVPDTRPRFTSRWFLNGEVDEAWMRIATNRRYDFFINGKPVRVIHAKPPDIDQGDWILGRYSSFDPFSNPELLDPDEIGDFFGGHKFENPRDAQADLEEFIPFKPKTHLPFRNYRTTNRAEEGGEFDPMRTLSSSRSTPDKPDLPAEQPTVNSLKRDRAIGGYSGYSLKKVLRPGWNTIEIRLVDEEGLNWPGRIAVDGMAHLYSGEEVPLPDFHQWSTIDVTDGSLRAVRPVNRVLEPEQPRLPRFVYRGFAFENIAFSQRFGIQLRAVMGGALALFVMSFALSLFLPVREDGGAFADREFNDGLAARVQLAFESLVRSRASVSAMLLVATFTLLCGSLLEMSLAERHEILWFQSGGAWFACICTATVLALGVGIADAAGSVGSEVARDAFRRFSTALLNFPQTRLWPHLVFWVLLLCFFLRCYKLEWQPLDDDEYASTQAVDAIMNTGGPKFVPDSVYYTRSPMYHYITALLALPFGGNLWSFRIQSALWSVATVYLTYLCGAKLLKSRWIGFTAMFLLTIHPFQIYTGHVIRFYQMQQFFALLTVYLFCKGFISGQNQRYRIATIICFFCAVVSQEISIVMGASLVLGYVLFAKDLGWKNNIQLVIYSVAVVMLIAVDILVFKTMCLTRTEGVSPNVEASISPHFWFPMNFFAIFIGYSRLHIVASFFMLVGLPLIWREKNLNAVAFLMFLFSGVVMTNLLVSHVSLRYQYWVFPLWILVSLLGLRLLLTTLTELVYTAGESLNRYVFNISILFVLAFLTIIMSWSPWRIPGSYDVKILGDSTGCVRWVNGQMRPGDKLAITEPHTHSGFIESGKVDYDIGVPLLYDFAVFQDGRLIDRNGGGELVTCVDDLIRLCETEDRVWFLFNREKFRTRGKNMRWEYPGSRFELFIRQNCELKHRTYLWSAYLWDSSRGHYFNFRQQE